MRKKKLVIFLLISTALFYVLNLTSVLAAPSNFENNSGLYNTGSNAGYGKLMEKTPADFYGSLIKGLLSFIGVVFLGYMIYAGYLWMTARGDEQKVTKAKAMIEQAIIGLALVLAAYAITVFIGFYFFQLYQQDLPMGSDMGLINNSIYA